MEFQQEIREIPKGCPYHENISKIPSGNCARTFIHLESLPLVHIAQEYSQRGLTCAKNIRFLIFVRKNIFFDHFGWRGDLVLGDYRGVRVKTPLLLKTPKSNIGRFFGRVKTPFEQFGEILAELRPLAREARPEKNRVFSCGN